MLNMPLMIRTHFSLDCIAERYSLRDSAKQLLTTSSKNTSVLTVLGVCFEEESVPLPYKNPEGELAANTTVLCPNWQVFHLNVELFYMALVSFWYHGRPVLTSAVNRKKLRPTVWPYISLMFEEQGGLNLSSRPVEESHDQ